MIYINLANQHAEVKKGYPVKRKMNYPVIIAVHLFGEILVPQIREAPVNPLVFFTDNYEKRRYDPDLNGAVPAFR